MTKRYLEDVKIQFGSGLGKTGVININCETGINPATDMDQEIFEFNSSKVQD